MWLLLSPSSTVSLAQQPIPGPGAGPTTRPAHHQCQDHHPAQGGHDSVASVEPLERCRLGQISRSYGLDPATGPSPAGPE